MLFCTLAGADMVDNDVGYSKQVLAVRDVTTASPLTSQIVQGNKTSIVAEIISKMSLFITDMKHTALEEVVHMNKTRCSGHMNYNHRHLFV